MSNNLMLVFSNPVAGQNDRYNAGYDNIHLGDGRVVSNVWCLTPNVRTPCEHRSTSNVH